MKRPHPQKSKLEFVPYKVNVKNLELHKIQESPFTLED